jgi:hypothetical protein
MERLMTHLSKSQIKTLPTLELESLVNSTNPDGRYAQEFIIARDELARRLLNGLSDNTVSPAVNRAKDFFWQKADEYDHDKLLSIYNDMHELQDRVETIPLSQALEALDLALQLIDRLIPKVA